MTNRNIDERRIARASALAYVTVSLTAAVLFVVAATVVGGYNDVARFGGAAWVFLLSMIVSMPLLTSYVKKRMRPVPAVDAQK